MPGHTTRRIAAMMLRHARPTAELLNNGPGHGNSGRFIRAMAARGYAVTEQRSRFDERDLPPFCRHLLSYRRDPSRPSLTEALH